MLLKRQVVWRAVVTERLKEQLKGEVQNLIGQVQGAQDELERQSRRIMLELQRTDLQRSMAVRQQVDAERQRHENTRRELEEQLQDYEGLELGTIVDLRTVEGWVDVNVGDNIVNKLALASILVEDDIVKEVSEG